MVRNLIFDETSTSKGTQSDIRDKNLCLINPLTDTIDPFAYNITSDEKAVAPEIVDVKNPMSDRYKFIILDDFDGDIYKDGDATDDMSNVEEKLGDIQLVESTIRKSDRKSYIPSKIDYKELGNPSYTNIAIKTSDNSLKNV